MPISDLGFEVTGVDVSRRMLLKAREKGLETARARRRLQPPFKDKAFDASMIIHVLHVVADWAHVMREIGRVTKGNIITILRLPTRPQSLAATGQTLPPEKRGSRWSITVRTQHRMWQNEQELKAQHPAPEAGRIRDETIDDPDSRRFQAPGGEASAGSADDTP